MSYFIENLEVIKDIDKELYDGILALDNVVDNIQTIDSKVAKDGSKYLEIYIGDKAVAMNSTYKPEVEADKYAQRFEMYKNESQIFVFGFGNGVFPRSILKNNQENNKYFFYEPNVEVFFHILKNYDIRDILNDKNVVLFVEGLNTEKMQIYVTSCVTYKNFEKFYVENLPKYKEIYEGVFFAATSMCQNIRNYAQADFNTRKLYSQKTVSNYVANLKYIFDANVIEDYRESIPCDIPVFIVGAGPSLAKNIKLLKEVKNHGIIIAAEAALKILLAADIMPDLVITADTHKALYWITDVTKGEIPFLIDSGANSDFLNLLHNPKIIYATTMCNYYKNLFGLSNRKLATLQSGGSVTTLAFCLACHLNMETIIFVGQDLAMTGFQEYAGWEDLRTRGFQRELIAVKGNIEETVFTTDDYKLYIEWFNMFIADVCKSNVINATEGGAYIEGTQVMTLREVVDKFCKQEFYVERMLNEIESSFNVEEKIRVYKKILATRQECKAVKQKINDAIEDLDNALRLLQRGGWPEKEINKVEKSVDKVNQFLNQSEIMEFLQIRTVGEEKELVTYLENKSEDVYGETINLYHRTKNYMENLLSANEELYLMFSSLIDEIRDRFE